MEHDDCSNVRRTALRESFQVHFHRIDLPACKRRDEFLFFFGNFSFTLTKCEFYFWKFFLYSYKTLDYLGNNLRICDSNLRKLSKS